MAMAENWIDKDGVKLEGAVGIGLQRTSSLLGVGWGWRWDTGSRGQRTKEPKHSEQ